MSTGTLPEIVELICKAVGRNDMNGARLHCKRAAQKLTGQRSTRASAALDVMRLLQPVGTVSHWTEVIEQRSPWVPASVRQQVDEWREESEHARVLAEAGEKVLPLLLSGPTRCGKTSIVASVARSLGIPLFRLNLGSSVGSLLGETTKLLSEAMAQVSTNEAIWLIDEIDAVASRRGGEQSASGREHLRSVGALLTFLDSVPSGVLLAATTNLETEMDPAVLGRMRTVTWPSWEELQLSEKHEFTVSHQGPAALAETGADYDDVVRRARNHRVRKIMSQVKEGGDHG